MAKINLDLNNIDATPKSTEKPADKNNGFNALEVIPANIPEELHSIDNWCVFRAEPKTQKDGSIRWTKPPLQSDGKTPAKVNDSKTWSSFQDCIEAMAFDSTLDGIGFVLTKGNELTAIDIDHCIINNEISQEVQNILDDINSYSELSPSGTGIRILCSGTIPDGLKGNKSDAYEIYDSGRYVTITGQHIASTPKDIEERPEAITRYHKKYITKAAPEEPLFTSTASTGEERREEPPPAPEEPLSSLSVEEVVKQWLEYIKNNATNADKIIALWNGEGITDHSAADQALCNHLAYYHSKNDKIIDAFFRQSKLFRPKWDERHYANGKTYGQGTIDKAISGTKSTFADDLKRKTAEQPTPDALKTPVIEFCTAFDIYQKNPQPKWIIKDFIPKGESTLISSSGGLGKSMFSLYLAHLLATKLEIHKPDHGGNLCIDFNEYLLFDEFPISRSGIFSLFLQTENSNPQINFRLRKIAGDNIEPLKRLCFPVINGSAITSGKTFIEEIGKEKSSKKFEQWFETLINKIQDQTKQKIDLVWLDPLISFCGCNENDNAEVRKNLDVLTVMAHKCEVTPIVIHHNAKNTEKDKDNTGYRGASAILDWTRNLITMNKTEIPEPFFIDGKMKTRKVPAINVKNVMSNVGKQFKDFKIRMDDNFRFTRLKEEAIDPATLKEINNVIQALKDMDNCFAESQNDLASKYSALTGKTNPTGKKYIKLAVEYDFIKEVNDGSKTYGYKLKE